MNTEIIVITDRSGSMASIASDTIGGYNTFICEQRKGPGDARVTFTQFDTEYEVVYAAKPIGEVPLLNDETFVPRGGTALLDAIGRTLTEQGRRIASEKWAELVVVCILTDGEENRSREFRLEQVAAMTSAAEARGWKFVYVGANQDAFAVSRSLGMAQAVHCNFSPDAPGVRHAYRKTSESVLSYRTMPEGTPKP